MRCAIRPYAFFVFAFLGCSEADPQTGIVRYGSDAGLDATHSTDAAHHPETGSPLDAAQHTESGSPMDADANPLPSCSDGIKNQGETAVDCGGPNCSSCPQGESCGDVGQECPEGTVCIAGNCEADP